MAIVPLDSHLRARPQCNLAIGAVLGRGAAPSAFLWVLSKGAASRNVWPSPDTPIVNDMGFFIHNGTHSPFQATT